MICKNCKKQNSCNIKDNVVARGLPIFSCSEKVIVDSATSSSSRFKPNVKFAIPTDADINKLVKILGKNVLWFGFWYTSVKGDSLHKVDGGRVFDFNAFEKLQIPEVSIYEAIPELVPKEMRYDKETDSLVQDIPDDAESSVGWVERNVIPFLPSLPSYNKNLKKYKKAFIDSLKDEIYCKGISNTEIHDTSVLDIFEDKKHNGFYYFNKDGVKTYIARKYFTKVLDNKNKLQKDFDDIHGLDTLSYLMSSSTGKTNSLSLDMLRLVSDLTEEPHTTDSSNVLEKFCTGYFDDFEKDTITFSNTAFSIDVLTSQIVDVVVSKDAYTINEINNDILIAGKLSDENVLALHKANISIFYTDGEGFINHE